MRDTHGGESFFDRDDLSMNSIMASQLTRGRRGTDRSAISGMTEGPAIGSSAQVGVRKPYGAGAGLGANFGQYRGPGGLGREIEEQDDEEYSPGIRRPSAGGRHNADSSYCLNIPLDEEQPDVLEMAEEMKIPHNDDLITDMGARIPVLH